MGTTPKKPRSDMSAGLSECLMALALSCDRTAKLAAAAWEALTPLGMREHLRNCRAEQRHARSRAARW